MMTYNKDEILNMLSSAPIYGGMIFHDGDNEEFINSLGSDFNDNFNYAFGATKFVLIPKDEEKNYVIKIPYTGCYEGEEEEDYVEYLFAECDDRPWDYCAGEVSRYMIAEREGLSDCFAKTKLLGFINDYPIYVQEKCNTFSSCAAFHQHSIEEKKKTSKCCHHYINISENWLTDFRLYYGENKLKQFIFFLQDFGWDDDLRSENIGYIGDRPVLIDYSGFLEEM